MAVDNAGRRRQQGRHAIESRLEPVGLCPTQPFQILDPVAASRGGDLLETGYLRLAGRHNQLAQPGMRDPVLAAIAVEPMAPFYTAARLQAAEGVIEPPWMTSLLREEVSNPIV